MHRTLHSSLPISSRMAFSAFCVWLRLLSHLMNTCSSAVGSRECGCRLVTGMSKAVCAQTSCNRLMVCFSSHSATTGPPGLPGCCWRGFVRWLLPLAGGDWQEAGLHECAGRHSPQQTHLQVCALCCHASTCMNTQEEREQRRIASVG